MATLTTHDARSMIVTMEAIEELDFLIRTWSIDKPGPACLHARTGNGNNVTEIQLDRKIAVAALTAQREQYITYIERAFGVTYRQRQN